MVMDIRSVGEATAAPMTWWLKHFLGVHMMRVQECMGVKVHVNKVELEVRAGTFSFTSA